MGKRMISSVVTGSDKFVELPVSAQALYFHLVLEGDNKGFFSCAVSTARKIGAKPEDIDTLVNNGFLIRFPGTPVMAITHWNMMNNLKDKVTKSEFQEAKMVRLDGGVYVLRDGLEDD